LLCSLVTASLRGTWDSYRKHEHMTNPDKRPQVYDPQRAKIEEELSRIRAGIDKKWVQPDKVYVLGGKQFIDTNPETEEESE
jgi:hypothetical protein